MILCDACGKRYDSSSGLQPENYQVLLDKEDPADRNSVTTVRRISVHLHEPCVTKFDVMIVQLIADVHRRIAMAADRFEADKTETSGPDQDDVS